MAAHESLSLEILTALRRIMRKTSQHSRQISRAAGLTVPQLLCLRAIADLEASGEVTGAKVAESIQLSPPTVSRILDRLEESGLVSRQRTSKDRRRVCLQLNDAGRRQLKALPIPLHEHVLRQLESLGHDECARLLQSLERIVEIMDATDLDAAPVLTPEEDVSVDHPAIQQHRSSD